MRPSVHALLLLTFQSLSLSGCGNEPKTSTVPIVPLPEALAAVAAPAIAVEISPGDWPNWRGPHFDGISRETDWKSDWPADGPRQLWKTNVGTGFSAVSVLGDRLYTMGHTDGDDTIFCLNTTNGSEVWKHSYPCKLVDNLHEGGPGATPTIDGDRLYTISKEGHLFCLDRNTGDVKWKQELQPLFGVKMPEWGFSGSAVVLGDKLIVDAGALAALNKLTGEVLWQTPLERPGYGTPTVFEHEGKTLIAWMSNDALHVVDATDGTILDQTPWQTDYATTACTPIVHEGAIFISSGYNRGCSVFDLKSGKLEQRYENKKMRNHMAACILWQDCLFGFDGNSHNASSVFLKCIDFATGEEKWKHRGLGCGTLAMAGDQLIVLSDEGKLLVAPASTEKFEPIAEAQVIEGRCWTVPVLSHGHIYCRNAAGELVCLDVQ